MIKKKILIIEDEHQMRDLLTLRFKTSGYEVSAASNGEDGLEEVIGNSPHLIILDLMLPGIGGYELCWRLKTDKQFCNIPILIFSARAGDLDKTKGFQCGADDYVTKPFDGEILENRVQQLLEKHPNVL